MANRKHIKSTQLYQDGLGAEKSGDPLGALKIYQKAVKANPTNVLAWNRQMIIQRKHKSKEEEIKLIQEAIFEYQKATQTQQENWLEENQTKAEHSRALAKLLGLLEPNGLPVNDDPTIEKWQTRLYLLNYRLKNARKKVSTKKAVPKKSVKKPIFKKKDSQSKPKRTEKGS